MVGLPHLFKDSMKVEDLACTEHSQQSDALIINEAQLILAEKRTSMAAMRTGIAVFALPLGTWLALDAMQAYGPPQQLPAAIVRPSVFYGLQIIIAGLLIAFYGSVVAVVSNKVPLKSAEYEIRWLSMDYEEGADGDPPTLHFDMLVHNRHPTLGLEVDHASLLLNLEGRYLGQAALNIPYVAPNSVESVPVVLQLGLDFSELAGIAYEEMVSLISGKQAAWRDRVQARLTVQLPMGLELPLYITEGYRHEFEER